MADLAPEPSGMRAQTRRTRIRLLQSIAAAFRPTLATVALAGLTLYVPARIEAKNSRTVEIRTSPVMLDESDAGRPAIGGLRYMGGLLLRSPDKAFGGLSAIRWDGDRLYAISDEGGTWFTLTLTEADGRLTGLESARMSQLTGPDGTALSGKRAADAESMNLNHRRCGRPTCAARSVSIGFERDHRILTWRLRDGMPDGRSTMFQDKTGWLQRQPDNEGIEAMAGDRRLTLLLSEGLRTASGDASGLLFRPGLDGRSASRRPPVGIAVQAAGDALPTDLAQIDDNHFILLRRSWNKQAGFAVNIERLTLSGDGAAVVANTQLLARFVSPVTTDNYEGAAIRFVDGRAFLYIVSDDNFDSGQRTMLLKFEIIG